MRIVGNPPSGGKKPTTPTIGTATDGGTGTTVSVAFTPSTYIGKGTITYTALSSPGSITATGSGSPITVSGLTTGTAYTFTVKGDTNYGVASDYSAASNSVTPASPTSFESIATYLGDGTASTFTFSSIPQTYKSLQIRMISRDDYSSSSINSVLMRPNNVSSTSSYTYHNLGGEGSTGYSSGVGTGTYGFFFMPEPSDGSLSSTFGAAIIDIVNYTSSNYKTMRAFTGLERNLGSGNGSVTLRSSLFLSTSAITSISFTTNIGKFMTGTSFALYGIK